MSTNSDIRAAVCYYIKDRTDCEKIGCRLRHECTYYNDEILKLIGQSEVLNTGSDE